MNAGTTWQRIRPQAESPAKPEFMMRDVTIYTRQFCGYCSAAKHLLEKKGVDYTEHDATFSKELRREMVDKARGGTTFPQIFIGDLHVGGSDELHELDRQGRLDAILQA